MRKYTIDDSERNRRSNTLKEKWEKGQLGKTLITAEKVEEVKALLLNGESVNEAAVKCGISNRTASRIKRGAGWGHLISKEEVDIMDKMSRHTPKVTILAIANEIIENKISHKEIAALYSVHPSVVTSIKTGKYYKNVIDSSTLEKMNARGIGRKLSKELKKEILKIIADGKMTKKDIAQQYNVHPTTISRIYKRSLTLK